MRYNSRYGPPSRCRKRDGDEDFFDEQRDQLLARYQGMLPHLEGTEKARIAGEIAALKYEKTKMPRLHL